ncbi:RDD family protein [Pseudoflavitalea rhizosphaerae]|uniref:RDD family protein n=1 Tax=Pseudoflavitalea rhizosphaerae TaxID=1884793 RepID=UPI000F8E8465|nr:RDD family protein [Pseudoflavitalea rhizosphaerae]
MENYPLLADRIKSTFIDLILLIGATILAANLLDRANNPPDWVRISIFIAIWIVYEPLCTAIGATMGNLIMGIRVRRYGNASSRINIVQALFRYIMKLCLGWISFLTINSNPERRAMHDMAVGSVLVRA